MFFAVLFIPKNQMTVNVHITDNEQMTMNRTMPEAINCWTTKGMIADNRIRPVFFRNMSVKNFHPGNSMYFDNKIILIINDSSCGILPNQ